MKRSIVTWLLVLLTSAGSFAQMRQMVWPLPNAWDTITWFNGGFSNGTKLILDFHTTPPTLLELPHNTLYGPHEAISSICNRWGQLQFYSDNHRVWNGSHELVENIDQLHDYIPANQYVFSSVANATMILPFPGDSLDRFFSLWTMNYQGEGVVPIYLQHSLIDRYGGSTGNGIL